MNSFKTMISYRCRPLQRLSPRPRPSSSIPRPLQCLLSTSSRFSYAEGTPPSAQPFGAGPAPPRLPKEDQETFERLQRSSTGAFSTPRPQVVVNQSPQSHTKTADSSDTSSSNPPGGIQSESEKPNIDRTLSSINARVAATGDGEELHPDVRRGARPEFEGDRNPKTGEVGGPKNEPLRWGDGGDWSYNGRVTDF
ncbi:MAG: putative mitochondrial protein, conserved [Sclerophora amabilis]|nr:MAG: putative mitochondrial protein, conserved [Sclerophora amabilis]